MIFQNSCQMDKKGKKNIFEKSGWGQTLHLCHITVVGGKVPLASSLMSNIIVIPSYLTLMLACKK